MDMIWWVITRVCDKDEPHVTFATHEPCVSKLIPQVNGYGRFYPDVVRSVRLLRILLAAYLIAQGSDQNL